MAHPNIFTKLLVIALLALFVAPVATYSQTPPPIVTAEIPVDSYDYNKIFKYTRELLTRKPVQKLLKDVFAEELVVDPKLAAVLGLESGSIKEMSEHQFVLLLQMNKKSWPLLDEYIKKVPEIIEGDEKQAAIRKEFREKFKALLEDPKVKNRFIKYNNPLIPRALETADGGPAYRNLKFVSNTQLIYKDGTVVKPGDLKGAWINWINGAEKQIAINVFDFDLMEVADALIAKAEAGLDVRVGIDTRNVFGKGSTKARPEVGEVYNKLLDCEKRLAKSGKGKMQVFAVDSTGLNHQKIGTRDWELKGKGSTITSSGNLTQSCSGKEGDLVGKGIKSKYSVPNANHLITMDSDIAAAVVNHQLTKTLDMGIRGSEYPLTGAWLLYADGKDVPAISRDFFVMAFTPSGALGSINDQMIGEMIRRRKGELRMLQFAYSSESVDQAILKEAQKEIAKTGTFSFRSVGDTPFAGREWSGFLSMLGYQKDVETKFYSIDPKNPWTKLPENVKEKLREQIKAAPSYYGEHSVELPDGSKIDVSSKIHDKVLMDDEKGFFGTSFNFSSNAEGNNEQILMFKDKRIMKDGHAMFEGLYKESDETLQEVIVRRNEYAIQENPALAKSIKAKAKRLTKERLKDNKFDCKKGLKKKP